MIVWVYIAKDPGEPILSLGCKSWQQGDQAETMFPCKSEDQKRPMFQFMWEDRPVPTDWAFLFYFMSPIHWMRLTQIRENNLNYSIY